MNYYFDKVVFIGPLRMNEFFIIIFLVGVAHCRIGLARVERCVFVSVGARVWMCFLGTNVESLLL